MTDHDRTLDEALAREERELLRRIGEEPGYFAQVGRLFGGRTGWVNQVLMLAQAGLFIGGCFAAWRFFHAPDTLQALHWGLPAAVLLLMSLMVKLALWPVIHFNQLKLDLRRLEVLLANGRLHQG